MRVFTGRRAASVLLSAALLGAFASPGQAAPAAKKPLLNPDCAAYSLYIDSSQTVHHVGSRVAQTSGGYADEMYDRNLGVRLPEAPVTAATVRLTATGTTITTVLVYTTTAGDLKRATIVSTVSPGGRLSSTLSPPATLARKIFQGTRALTATGHLLYSLAGPYLVRYDLRPDLSGVASYAHLATGLTPVRTLTFAGSTTSNGVTKDRLRSLSGDALVDVAVTRASRPTVVVTAVGSAGWAQYTHVFAGGCTRSPNVVLDLAVRQDRTTDLWYEPTGKTNPRTGVRKLARFGNLRLPAGRFHG